MTVTTRKRRDDQNRARGPQDAPEPLRARSAEESVVGGCLLSTDALDDVLEFLRPEHFSESDLQIIFRTIMTMRNEGAYAIDTLTVAERIEKDGLWNEAGGVRAILEAIEAVPHAGHSRDYAKIVRDKWRRRTAHDALWDLKEQLADPGADTDAVLAEAEQSIHDALDDSTDTGPAAIGDILVEAIATIGSGRQPQRHVASGLQSLDNLCGGFPVGGLTIVGARPSVGKTSLLMSAAMRAAETGEPVLFFSYEQKRVEMAERLLSQVSGVSFTDIRRGNVNDQTKQQLLQSAAMLNRVPLYLDESSPPELQLAAIIRRCVRRHKVKLVIVDYLQLIEPADYKAPREQQVAQASRRLKKLAMNLNVAIVVASQLNRESEKREDKRPRLSDLRESGSIEQDADLVWMLWRPGKDDFDRDDDTGEVIVAKQRNGALGNVLLTWNGPTMSYRDQASTIHPDILNG